MMSSDKLIVGSIDCELTLQISELFVANGVGCEKAGWLENSAEESSMKDVVIVARRVTSVVIPIFSNFIVVFEE